MVLTLRTEAPSEFVRIVAVCLKGRQLAKMEVCSLQFTGLRRQANVRGFSGSPNTAIISDMERHQHIEDFMTVLSRVLIWARIDSC